MEPILRLDESAVSELREEVAALDRPIQVMEICGTHTMAIARGGLRSLLGRNVRFISGPGCPVCVTDGAYLDQAMMLAGAKEAPIVATYGDMVRVPGSKGSLADARAAGADVRITYSVDQAVELAARNPDRQVVFLAVGFETTAPGTALALLRARREERTNFSVLTAHKQVLPAMEALLASGRNDIDAFLCPGHVSVILGYSAYEGVAEKYRRPCVVAGFEPRQVLTGLVEILRQIRAGRPRACTVYPPVTAGGNAAARKVLAEVFEPCDAAWRGLGVIPGSGLALRGPWADYEAALRFHLPPGVSHDDRRCRCGQVIRGLIHPFECGLFAKACTPTHPVGPCMVSSEGACAAAYKYERNVPPHQDR